MTSRTPLQLITNATAFEPGASSEPMEPSGPTPSPSTTKGPQPAVAPTVAPTVAVAPPSDTSQAMIITENSDGTPAIPRDNEESPRKPMGKRGPNRITPKPFAAKRGKKTQDVSGDAQIAGLSGPPSDETASSSTPTPATDTTLTTDTTRSRQPAPALGKGTYGKKCPDIIVTQEHRDEWDESLPGERRVRAALRKLQQEFNANATKAAVNATKRTTGQNLATATESEADMEPEPASTSSAHGQAGLQAVLPNEVGDGEEAHAERSEDDSASEGPDAASIPDDSESDTDSQGPFDEGYRHSNSDPEITIVSTPLLLPVENQDELLAQLLLLKAEREAEEKKKVNAARARKAAETRAKKKREREDAGIGDRQNRRRSARLSTEALSPSSSDLDNINSPDRNLGGPSAERALVPFPRLPLRAFPNTATPEELIRFCVERNEQRFDHLEGRLTILDHKLDRIDTKLDALDDMEYKAYRASWFMLFLDDATAVKEGPDSFVIVNKLHEPFIEWMGAHRDPAVIAWRSEHLQRGTSDDFMANGTNVKRFILAMVKDFDIRDGALVKYRRYKDNQKDVLMGRVLRARTRQ